jgi:hypothetical protein
MSDQLERAIQALRQAESTDQGPAAPINQQRVTILEKVRPAVSPNLNADLRRDPRIAVTVAAGVRVGLGRICRDLASKDTNEPANDSSASAEQIEVYAVDGPRAKPRAAANEQDSLAASISSFSDPMWQVRPRVAGAAHRISGEWPESCARRSSPCASPISPIGCWVWCDD